VKHIPFVYLIVDYEYKIKDLKIRDERLKKSMRERKREHILEAQKRSVTLSYLRGA